MNKISTINNIQNQIYNIRDIQVMIDRDLAKLYGVETKVLNQAVKRNIGRFPKEFRFQLTIKEKNKLVTNCDRLKNLKHSTTNPYVFTEPGVVMLASVLKSDVAIKISIEIVKAFIKIRHFLSINALIFQRLDYLEHRQLLADKKFNKLFLALEKNNLKPKQGIFYQKKESELKLLFIPKMLLKLRNLTLKNLKNNMVILKLKSLKILMIDF